MSCRVGSDNGKHFGFQMATRFRRPTWKNGCTWVMTPQKGADYKDCTTKHKLPEDAPSAPRSSWQAGGEHDTPTWKLSGTQGTASFSPRPQCNFIHAKQLSPFPERLKLPCSSEEILSGYKDVQTNSLRG